MDELDVIIYRDANGATARLTTASPASSYGIPVLRIEGPGCDDWPDLGPFDVLPSGTDAAHVVHMCATGILSPGIEGRIEPMSLAAVEAARRFLSQWSDGPQL